jgi:hypothetical protein
MLSLNFFGKICSRAFLLIQAKLWDEDDESKSQALLKFVEAVLAIIAFLNHGWQTGMPDICFGTTYQNGEKYIKWLQNVLNCHKIYTKWLWNTPNVPKIYQHFPFQGPPKYNQIEIFGLKIYNLATLGWIRSQSYDRKLQRQRCKNLQRC